jgi:hypothetical protein
VYPEAIEALRKLQGPPTLLGVAYAQAGLTAEARKIVELLEQTAKTRYLSPIGLAFVYAALGEKDRAMQSLDSAYEERSPQMAFLKRDPKVDSLRADPRFKDLLRRVGLPP